MLLIADIGGNTKFMTVHRMLKNHAPLSEYRLMPGDLTLSALPFFVGAQEPCRNFHNLDEARGQPALPPHPE